MFVYEHSIRVRYAETDQMGFVHHGNYPMYYEEARTEAFRFLGMPYRELEDQGLLMPVREMNCRYLQPAYYDQQLLIKVTVPEMPIAKFLFEYQIFNEDNVLINKAFTVLVLLDKRTNKLVKSPQEVRQLFEPYFEVVVSHR